MFLADYIDSHPQVSDQKSEMPVSKNPFTSEKENDLNADLAHQHAHQDAEYNATAC